MRRPSGVIVRLFLFLGGGGGSWLLPSRALGDGVSSWLLPRPRPCDGCQQRHPRRRRRSVTAPAPTVLVTTVAARPASVAISVVPSCRVQACRDSRGGWLVPSVLCRLNVGGRRLSGMGRHQPTETIPGWARRDTGTPNRGGAGDATCGSGDGCPPPGSVEEVKMQPSLP
ncbi:Os04g0684400 [Oryza sativa Japonica Group]|uniref:Os04g0684400 protein n=1 Tax=Oryza sativa subsp. japonica TaxID=39947 RepID=C7J1Y9_ORYSJ|nr:Os04g0684400 [Oryza sativa Japonica Group]|eukprot:NP_001174150.1 Os04g0684400 [Oryza sativa Japonica Group]